MLCVCVGGGGGYLPKIKWRGTLFYLGSISSMFDEQLLRVQILKVQKKSKVVSLCCALGSALAKAVRRTLVKLTPVNNDVTI